MTPGLETKEKSLKEKKTKKQKTKKAKSKVKQLLRIRCPICFNNLAKGTVVSTKCGHVFCRHCLQKALIQNPICPMCRKRLAGFQGYHSLYLDQNICDDFEDIIEEFGT
ncbi:unnamed protein product [Arctia plantaginis]|uniref:RING-type domain-containing protein n=1 Tax=Arctia plantaginis TaxID=874455 RepID=A0A8S1B196_ARCPL|nr:unnamed protein product [Arctia plantaginis]